MSYKITRFLNKRWRGESPVKTTYWLYEAKTREGWIGLGKTPTSAILDMRHEFRQMADDAEQGRCLKGVYHKNPL